MVKHVKKYFTLFFFFFFFVVIKSVYPIYPTVMSKLNYNIFLTFQEKDTAMPEYTEIHHNLHYWYKINFTIARIYKTKTIFILAVSALGSVV